MVTLKPLTENDLPFLLEVRNDESTRQFLEHDSKFTLKEALKVRKFLKRNKRL